MPVDLFPPEFNELVRLEASQSLASTGLLRRKVLLRTRAGLIYQERPAPHNPWHRPREFRASGGLPHDPMAILVAYARANLLPLASAMSERWSRDLPRLLRLDPLSCERGRAAKAVIGQIVVTMDLVAPKKQIPQLVESSLIMTHRDAQMTYLSRMSYGSASFNPAQVEFSDRGLRELLDDWRPLRQLIAADLEDLYLPILARIPRSR
jgi:hypothetical protein